jgi:hypothetical protein
MLERRKAQVTARSSLRSGADTERPYGAVMRFRMAPVIHWVEDTGAC